MLSPMYTFSAHNNRLALSALHDGLEALHCSSDGPNMGPLGGPLLGKSEGHGDSGFIGNDKLRLCKAVPNLYVELRQSVLRRSCSVEPLGRREGPKELKECFAR